MKIVKKFSHSKVEWKYINQLVENIQNDTLKQYVENQISWHTIKAYRYRFYEHALKFLIVAMPTAVTVAQQYLAEDSVWKQTLILGAATVTSASGVFLKLHEKRVLYRQTAEKLKEETAQYINCVGCYKKEERDSTLFSNLQRIVKSTNKQWETIEKEVQQPGVIEK